jgi:hypothetical protein
MQRARMKSSRGSWPQRVLLGAAVLVRVLSLLLSFELSGLGRDLSEVLVLTGQVEAHADDCSGESPHDCPPGCGACHCNAGCALPSEPNSSDAPALPLVTGALSSFDAHGAPLAPPLPGLFRPPRA